MRLSDRIRELPDRGIDIMSRIVPEYVDVELLCFPDEKYLHGALLQEQTVLMTIPGR